MSRINCLIIIGVLAFLTAVHCRWICSDESKVEINGNFVNFTSWGDMTCKYKTKAVKTNGSRYYEFTVIRAAFGCLYGLSIETRKNDGMKGIYYGPFGVSDGVNTNYNFPSQGIRDGDKIGFLTEETENDLKVYLYVNKHPLGMIYHLSPKPSKPLYPYFLATWLSSVSIDESETLPTDREIELVPIEGIYEFDKYSVNNGTEVEFTEEWKNYTFEFVLINPRPYLLGVKVDPKKYWINIKFNDFNTYCTTTKRNEKWSELDCKVEVIPLPEGVSLEAYKFIEELINNDSSIEFNESEKTLTITSTGGPKIILKQVFRKSGPAVTISPFKNRKSQLPMKM